jgi:hypothetical protein
MDGCNVSGLPETVSLTEFVLEALLCFLHGCREWSFGIHKMG